MNNGVETDKDRRLRFVDTGKVKIGIYHTPRCDAPMFSDMEVIQRSLLPRELGSLHAIAWPTPRSIVRWLMS